MPAMRHASLQLLLLCICTLHLVSCVVSQSEYYTPIQVKQQIEPARAKVRTVRTLVPQPMIAASFARDAQARSFPDDLPPGTPLAGEFVVIYEPGVIDMAAATAESRARAASVVSAEAATGTISAASLGEASAAATILSAPRAPSKKVPSQAIIQVPADSDPETVRAALLAGAGVRAVVQNRVVSLPRIQPASSSCSPAYTAAGISASGWDSNGFEWENCLNEATAMAFFGERCGPNKEKFMWTGIYAFRKSTQQLYNSKCIWLRSDVNSTAAMAAYFGGCGVAAENFPELPTTVCQESADSACVPLSSLSSYTTTLSRRTCANATASRTAVYRGVRCGGPGGTLIQWNRLAPYGCPVKARLRMKSLQAQADWLGQCGVPPYQVKGLPTRICAAGEQPSPAPYASPSPTPSSTPSPSPSPTPSSTPSPSTSPSPAPFVAPGWSKLQSGDAAGWGMQRIGAFEGSSSTVVDASAAIAASGVKVVTIDTGADRTHPDLNVAEFVDLVNANTSMLYRVDGNGHGTHVAGIIGAKNNGLGVVGVVPGMPIIALKVLGADGSGTVSTVYQAFANVLARLQRGAKIAAVNLSLTMSDSSNPPSAADIKATCDYISQIAAYGTAVVVASGNDYGYYLGDTLPGLCPDAIAVTSMTSTDNPSDFSNEANTDSPASILDTTIAAPGSGIYSTYPVAQGSYKQMDGTSMASPHVAGGFAKCALSGACKLSSTPNSTPARTTNYPVVVAAAKATACGSNGRCGPTWGTSSYYGYMLNVKQL